MSLGKNALYTPLLEIQERKLSNFVWLHVTQHFPNTSDHRLPCILQHLLQAFRETYFEKHRILFCKYIVGGKAVYKDLSPGRVVFFLRLHWGQTCFWSLQRRKATRQRRWAWHKVMCPKWPQNKTGACGLWHSVCLVGIEAQSPPLLKQLVFLVSTFAFFSVSVWEKLFDSASLLQLFTKGY